MEGQGADTFFGGSAAHAAPDALDVSRLNDSDKWVI
jgi:hypothetical protein